MDLDCFETASYYCGNLMAKAGQVNGGCPGRERQIGP
jgi:hypothetical protein